MYKKTKKTVMAALMAALICVATFVVRIPTPLHGYVNLGDCLVLFAASILSPWYAALAAGLGSALADLISGYVIYAPATFVIKALMALLFCLFIKGLKFKGARIFIYAVGALLAEILMVLGYLIFEACLYGFAAAVINIPANCIQGAAGVIIGTALIKIFERVKIAARK